MRRFGPYCNLCDRPIAMLGLRRRREDADIRPIAQHGRRRSAVTDGREAARALGVESEWKPPSATYQSSFSAAGRDLAASGSRDGDKRRPWSSASRCAETAPGRRRQASSRRAIAR